MIQMMMKMMMKMMKVVVLFGTRIRLSHLVTKMRNILRECEDKRRVVGGGSSGNVFGMNGWMDGGNDSRQEEEEEEDEWDIRR